MHLPRLRDVLWRRLAPLAPLLATLHCAPADPPDTRTEPSALIHRPHWTLPLGIVTGAIYQDVNEPLQYDATRIMCEYAELGVKWIRIEADWPGVSPTTYQTIVQAAHAQGIKVTVVVPTTFCRLTQATCESADPLACYVFDYLATLDRLVAEVFSDAAGARVDAFEIGNEPNVGDPTQCGFAGEPTNAMAAADFVTLLRGVRAWKIEHRATELIISGGLRDTYTGEPYWSQLVNALAADEGIPFDEFGVHPYDMERYQEAPCSVSGVAAGLDCWQRHVSIDLAHISQLVQTPVFVTAFGWQDAQVQTDGMKAATQAFTSSGVVDAAFWSDYRDDVTSSGGFGLRGSWDATLRPPQYPPKPAWNQFYGLAHASSGAAADPNLCWQGIGGVCHPPTPLPPAICCDANITTDCLPEGRTVAHCGLFPIPNPACNPNDPECVLLLCGQIGESCDLDLHCAVDASGVCSVTGETPKPPRCGPGQPPGTFGCVTHYCGDNACDALENAVTCPSDCPYKIGDGVCGPDEPSNTDDCFLCQGS